ncbi:MULTISPECIES: type II secretion system secretin GspD [Marinovum]|jgi:general secretion pathway protein D|uniref:General secretion pathway protein D n=1 Tax=Marinovum algicola TaxID=42444 RepID=A0A975WEB6_9RHOB|nr:type II secretion system secretin GspD [Marinovum algicola]SEK06759.1 general secretion pathway protein D [Marinovum algicola]SLN76155.1 Type II secretion system protein D precursor [Marinovum algicola]
MRAVWQVFYAVALVSTLVVALLAGGPLMAQEDDGETFVVNLRNTEITVLAEQVSEITGRTLVIDPGLQGPVTVVSAEPLTRAGVWALFQSILRVRGFTAVESGVIWEVIPEAEARAKGGTLSGANEAGSQDVVTRLLPLDRLPSEEAVRVLRPLVAESGYIEALSDPNAIIVSDARANVDRIAAIAATFDSPESLKTEVVRFTFAEAATVATAITEVLGSAGTGARISVDPQANALLVRGSDAELTEIRLLAESLDRAPRSSPQEVLRTHIYQLKFADAEAVAEIVANTIRGGADLANPVADAEASGAPVQPGAVTEVSVQPSPETNAVVIRGTERQVAEVTQLVDALDKRRAQVVIEAAIVEVSGEVADRIGTQLGIGPDLPQGVFASTSFDSGGAPLSAVLTALGVAPAGALASGLTLAGTVDDFGILVQALSQSSRANLLSTPSITTMDNRAASIVVGQNVPFRTGSFATDGNTAEPFTTIERRDVGITMEVLPRVTAGGVVRLDITQEVSSLVNTNVQGAADLITNRRVIETTVQARDGGTVVLGGLITDDSQALDSKVPGLGDAPLVGRLFRSKNRQQTRRTLFVFMRPTVIDSEYKMKDVAQKRYQRLRKADADELPRNLLKSRKVKRIPLEIDGLY